MIKKDTGCPENHHFWPWVTKYVVNTLKGRIFSHLACWDCQSIKRSLSVLYIVESIYSSNIYRERFIMHWPNNPSVQTLEPGHKGPRGQRHSHHPVFINKDPGCPESHHFWPWPTKYVLSTLKGLIFSHLASWDCQSIKHSYNWSVLYIVESIYSSNIYRERFIMGVVEKYNVHIIRAPHQPSMQHCIEQVYTPSIEKRFPGKIDLRIIWLAKIFFTLIWAKRVPNTIPIA